MCTSVFDNLIWHTIGLKTFLFGTAQFSLWARGAVHYVCGVLLCMYYTCVLFLAIEDADKTSFVEDEKGSLYTSQKLIDEVKKKLSVIEKLKLISGYYYFNALFVL